MSHPNHNRPTVQACPPPEDVTEKHIDSISVLIETLKPFILPMTSDPHTSIPQPRERLDGEAGVAATTTFIKACARLDAILDDQLRWTLDPHKKLYDLLNANYAQQFEFLKSQTNASNALARPFFLLKPDLVQTEDGEFVAYTGNVTTPGMGLLGKGNTPAEAFADFDAAFYRQQQHVLENTDPKPKRKKK